MDLQQRRLCGKAPLVSVNCPATCRGAQNFITSFLWLTKKREEKREREEGRGEEEERGAISETSAANHKTFVACIFNTFFSVCLFCFYSGLWYFPGEGATGATWLGSRAQGRGSAADTESSAYSPVCFRGWACCLQAPAAGIGHRVAIIVYRLPFDWAGIRMPITRPVNGSQTRGLRLHWPSIPLPRRASPPFIFVLSSRFATTTAGDNIMNKFLRYSTTRNISLLTANSIRTFQF